MLNYSANGPSGYNLTNSLRFRQSTSAYLSRTPASAGSRTTYTISTWVKRGLLNDFYALFGAGTSTAGVYDTLRFDSSNKLQFFINATSSANLVSTSVYRDPSAWYHIVLAVDTTQATAANRIKLYVNGIQVTAFDTANYPAQNTTASINNNVFHTVGAQNQGSSSVGIQFDGYFAEYNFIDGQALTPSSFGNTNSVTGVWQPAKYTGTYGTNGFYLPFKNSSSSGFSSYYGSFNGTNQSLSATLPATLSGQFTIEGWIRPNVVSFNPLFTLGDALNATGLEFYFGGGSTPTVWSNNASRISGAYDIPSNTWAHVAITRDSSNVIRLFMNGFQIGGTYTSSSAFSNTLRIGVEYYSGSITGYMNGYISNFRIVTGSALYTSNFNPPSSAFTAISGTQILTLQNATIIDNSTNALTITNNNSVTTTSSTVATYSQVTFDLSGNNNNWFPNNINYSTVGTTYDSMTDVPTLTSTTTANYGTWNPLNAFNTTTSSANLNFTMSANNTQSIQGTFGMTSGKWYFESAFTSADVVSLIIGIVGANYSANGSRPYTQSTGYMYTSSGNKINNGSGTAYGSTYTTNDIIGVAVDLDNGKIWFSKNGTWQASGDPAAGTNPAYTGLSGSFVASVTNGNDGVNYAGWINCGQRPFSYTAPSGFNPLNTYNLPTSTIVQGNKYMDATLYTGNGTGQSVVNASGFKPDLIWTKSRSSGTLFNNLMDSVRGTNKDIYSNSTAAEETNANIYTAINSNGFSVGTDNSANQSGQTFVGWQWQAGQGSTSTNTSGSITSTVSVNASAGFSIVTYTGTGSNATVGHGLGVAPAMIITKQRNSTGWWGVYNKNLSAGNVLILQGTNASSNDNTYYTTTAPTSSVFSVGTSTATNGSASTYVSYCWAEIAGFSKFGSYTGNGSTDGPFCYTGFRPKYLMIKRTDSTSEWLMFDTSRSTYNQAKETLLANSSGAEFSYSGGPDILSNGFKNRGSSGNTDINANGGTYIYACFAENPFKNALAR